MEKTILVLPKGHYTRSVVTGNSPTTFDLIWHIVENRGQIIKLVGVVFGLFMLTNLPTYAQQDAIDCITHQISPEMTDSWINPSSIESSADGQIVYLISSRDSNFSTLMHVSPENVMTEVGQLDNNMLGVYGKPRWNVDIENGNVVFSNYIGNDVNTTLMLMDMASGDIITLMDGVTENDFGRDSGRIWWSSRTVDDSSSDYGLYLLDTATETITAFNVPAVADDSAYSGRLIQILPDGDVLFDILRLTRDPMSDRLLVRASYYRGDSQTGTSLLLHTEDIDPTFHQSADRIAVLDDRIVYINGTGVYEEIDFESNVLITLPLLGAGYYQNLHPTPNGVLFNYSNLENASMDGIYHMSTSGILSELIPDGTPFYNIISNVEVLTTSDGTSTLWFNIQSPTDFDWGILYVYALPRDDTIAMTEPALVLDDVADFYTSPTGTYVVTSINRSAVVIDTSTFAQTLTQTDYYENEVLFDGDQKLFLNEGRIQFFDTTQDIVYYSSHLPPQDADKFILYARAYNGTDSVKVSLPDVVVPFDFHSDSFMLAADHSVLYVGARWQSLYRAHCQRNES